LLIDSYTEEPDINVLLSASESYMLEHQEASEIIEEVRVAIKDWRKTATELQIPIKLLESYSVRWEDPQKVVHSTRFP
jgi:serine/threonine-protein kinase HipA